ncbi:hypothetical protein EDEG_02476 [Edhazardia aedis USNM 41457]|uniref:Uncharacterized protein n=1 Tax=Edhazardia aedis (strain USNM 41457) TaxID=1003232 RepID=J9D5W5_EDHAE|nr:hypothetical protein EDEG_02476 [Edhazardia aedis USNM 41457]|eukprot:EJW03171.1 hypothetical protein EDEG_02476 [Edhazardia aedis USNM 41457]
MTSQYIHFCHKTINIGLNRNLLHNCPKCYLPIPYKHIFTIKTFFSYFLPFVCLFVFFAFFTSKIINCYFKNTELNKNSSCYKIYCVAVHAYSDLNEVLFYIKTIYLV